MSSTVDPRPAASAERAAANGTAYPQGRSDPHNGTDQKLGALVTRATRDLSELLRGEVALAKAEVAHDVKQAAAGGGLFGAAALFGLFALIMLSVAGVYGIHETGLSLVWCWLIVGGAYLLITLMAAGLGLLHVKRLRGARSTKRSAGASIAMLKRSR
jgi:hypothetical protein